MTSKTRSIRVHLDEDLYRRVSTHAGALGLSVQRTIIATLAAHVPLYDRRMATKLGMVSGIDEAIEGGSTSPTPPRTPTSHKTGMSRTAVEIAAPEPKLVVGIDEAIEGSEGTAVVITGNVTMPGRVETIALDLALDPLLAAAGINPKSGDPK